MPWYFGDTETGEEIINPLTQEKEYHLELNAQKFLMGGIIDERGKYEDFLNVEDMKKRIFEIVERDNSQNKTSYFYFHNATYDFYTIFNKELKKNPYIRFENGFQINYLCHYPFMAQYGKWERTKEGKNHFKTKMWILDSMAFFKGSLKEMGLDLGYEKQETPLITKDFQQLRDYQQRDCEVLQKFMMNFKSIVKELGINPKKYLTIGQIAMAGFLDVNRKNGNIKTFYKDKEIFKGQYVNEVRGAFRGGRMECFKLGKFKNCVKIDVNSMYPYIMRNMRFPDLFSEFKVIGKDCEEFLDRIGVVKCKIKAPNKQKCPIPYLGIRVGEDTFYPDERILEASWTTLEIKKAISLGYEVLEYKEGIFYKDSKVNPLTEFIDRCWKVRKESQGVKRKIVKNIANSLFGKFGQRREDETNKIIERRELESYQMKGWEFITPIDDKYLIGMKGKAYYVKNSNPIIALMITAIGRDMLYDYMCRIGAERMIYVVTDAIIFQDERIKEAKDLNSIYSISVGEELGQFKLEGIGDCEMFGENQYLFGDEIKIGGIPKKDISAEVLKEGKEIKTSKIIGIKEAMLNPAMSSKIGTFRLENKRIVTGGKLDVILPNHIIEKEEKKYWGI